jgi:hypothetical protein
MSITSIPAIIHHRSRWRSARITIRSRYYRGEPRVSVRIGEVTILLDNARALRLANELVDAYETAGDDHD